MYSIYVAIEANNKYHHHHHHLSLMRAYFYVI